MPAVSQTCTRASVHICVSLLLKYLATGDKDDIAQLPTYVPAPYIFLLPVPHLVLSCSEDLVVATGKGLIKAVALSDTFLPQEPPPPSPNT